MSNDQSNPAFMPAHALRDAYDAGNLSPSDVVEAQLQRIDQYEPQLAAFTEVYADDARKAAAAATDAIRGGLGSR